MSGIIASTGGWLLEPLATLDPGPLFVLSLLPYLAFLRWAGRSGRMPKLALRGFQFTLVFVAVTIVAAVIAQQQFGRQLADVDGLHGGAEAFLTIGNLMILLGFRQPPGHGADTPDQPDP
ncbi:DUF3593 domain-containing protein [Synechococcus sp. CS-1325]|uniref:DUF3593 domain-containing protein n=1 Tax=unclassified Synechococcus TaxID=2626047 RepID=UPI000DB70227|nr:MULTISPECIES: DUF3593 domain-containing protein [unclassified Synechococcus]MCT0199426.1 DUF3593 domain-containing protein [Synechococcus sp. CS-1325]MCT0231748.1 DUF3593 domain-containing protein [Synechococcus sp. CS-1324]PZV03035.1 MAG: DUF3593 domain-containing protein [Cyanobium sp.]PZV04774.1 MAG: DUF3593 domain-containing protein [Cyanobium sp.]